jgi:hypothetical protein
MDPVAMRSPGRTASARTGPSCPSSSADRAKSGEPAMELSSVTVMDRRVWRARLIAGKDAVVYVVPRVLAA